MTELTLRASLSEMLETKSLLGKSFIDIVRWFIVVSCKKIGTKVVSFDHVGLRCGVAQTIKNMYFKDDKD